MDGIDFTPERGHSYGDSFGHALAADYFDGDEFADLAVGVPTENFATIFYAGAVDVLYGGFTALSAEGDQFWHQDVDGIDDAVETYDGFGLALAPKR